ncbi:MAG: pantetheine-phosphate adenylyltransferase [Clostridiales Family XIII bacterium]|jgi:pantetheine-phosphate adenylyltransferase|nr:pantetheine-phosphate adenylyltransferase [Clostridiales Family XIII bacterium]
MSDRKMLYAGTFDPITNGHLDMIRRGAAICDELIVGVLVNPAKQPYFTLNERMEMIRASIADVGNATLVRFDGLLADYVNQNGIDVVLRGLRGPMDFEYELRMAHVNAGLYEGGVETVFLMTDPALSFLSSSIVKEVFVLGGDVSGLVPPAALAIMGRHENKSRK